MNEIKKRVVEIIGQGYVGLPLAMAAVESGWRVIGIDSLESKVAQINSGSSPVEDITSDTLKKALDSGKYLATSDFSEVKGANIVTICVPTPLGKERNPDLSLLESAIQSISPHISENSLVVSESTSFPGTLRNIIIPRILAHIPNVSKKIYFASAPERVNPGELKWNKKNTPRLVGGIDEESQSIALDFYRSICDEVVAVSSPEVAEAAKLLENTFRLVNIALINEFAQVCASAGLNIHDIINAAETKPYGFMPFRPGVGVGGHCIPVDPLYLTWWARKNGAKATFVENADLINQAMPIYVARRALALVSTEVQAPKILILGVSYKSGVGDVRETPMSKLREHLISLGAEVIWHDPLVSDWEGTTSVPIDSNCDVAVLATAQPGMELNRILAKKIKILDCTNTLQPNSHTHLL